MSSPSLIVPLAIWNQLPTAQVTTVAYKDRHVVTGLKSGHIWIYLCMVNEKGDVELEHKVFCIGHKSAVSALVILEEQTDGSVGNDYVVISAAEDGELIKWCLLDGRCVSSIQRAFDGILRSLKPITTTAEQSKFLLCTGFSSEIIILNSTTLEVLRVWAGHNDWATCTPFYDSDSRQIRLLTVNFSGKLRTWSFDEQKRTITKVCDNMGSLEIQGDKILRLHSNPYDIGVILAVSSKYVVIFTIKQEKVLNVQGIKCPSENAIWSSGAFLSKTRVILWTKTGEAYLYLLPPSGERRTIPDPRHVARFGPKTSRSSSLPPSGSLDNSSPQVPSRPLLLEAIHLNETDRKVNTAITTVFIPATHDNNSKCWYLLSFRNQPDDITYVWKSLCPFGIGHPSTNHSEKTRWSPETSLSNLWPLKESPNSTPKVTVSTSVYCDRLAFGYENGDIRLVPIYLALTQSEDIFNSPDVQLFSGHTGCVTCLYVPDHVHFGKKYLISGGEDCSVRIWSLENGRRLATFTVHSQQVRKFFEPPSEVGPRIRGCVISVAKDNSLAIISLEEMSCLYVFGGYPYPVLGVQWRPSEQSLLLLYGDETVHVWQMPTSSLSRIVKGSQAREMTSDKQWMINRISSGDGHRNNLHQTKGKTLTSFAVDSSENAITPLHIFMINIKQLINDIYHYHVSALGAFSVNQTNGTNDGADDLDEKTATQSKIFSWTQTANDNQSSRSAVQPTRDSGCDALGAGVVQGLVSALMSWDLDPSLDRKCTEKLGLKRPIGSVAMGIKGANGNLSIAAPSQGKTGWKISPHMTAVRLLSIVGLTRSFLSMKGLEKYTGDILAHYSSLLPELVGAGFRHSCLYFLSKHFQDSTVDIQQASRALFSSSLENMPLEEQTALVDFWKQFLPAVNSQELFPNQYMARSTILLGMIGADHPNVLPEWVAKSVALSLALLLNDDSKPAHRLAVLELCGKGFATWEPHFNAAAVLRTLFTLAMDVDTTNISPVKAMARQAIYQIASVNTPLFISTLTYDTLNAKKPSEKNGYLKLLSWFIRKKPLILYTSLPRLVETVVKSLDPNIPNLRDTVLQTTTSILHDMVKTYPSITFHGRSQKLAVGTLEGASIIYDLRTATRWHILEGHTRPVTAISFSVDGKFLISCSLDERTVRVWNPNPGFLGMLTESLAAGAKPVPNTLASSVQPSRTFGFNIGDDVNLPISTLLNNIHFEWVAERTAKLFVQELTMSFNI